jgi:hypothetical protein
MIKVISIPFLSPVLKFVRPDFFLSGITSATREITGVQNTMAGYKRAALFQLKDALYEVRKSYRRLMRTVQEELLTNVATT